MKPWWMVAAVATISSALQWQVPCGVMKPWWMVAAVATISSALQWQVPCGVRRRGRVVVASVGSEEEVSGIDKKKKMGVVFIVGTESASPYGLTSPRPQPGWEEVGRQLSTRLNYFDDRITGTVLREDDPSLLSPSSSSFDAAVALGVRAPGSGVVISKFAKRSGAACLLVDDESCAELRRAAYCGPYEEAKSLSSLRARMLPWTRLASGKRVGAQALTLLSRHSSEDACFAVLFALNAFVSKIPVAASDINPSWEKGPLRNAREFATMARCCGPEIFAALTDPTTKKAIDLLNAVDLRDQVGSYRVIVSNETPQLEAFSLCILQQNNCFNCDAKIPERPAVAPLAAWRGKPLDADADRQILMGHLDHPEGATGVAKEKWSWKIVSGANPAYDAFPCQHQIFYPDGRANSSALWYDPVFLVETLEGPRVWTKRHYRCAPRGKRPGAWTLSTLDNGIVSIEHWTTIAAADDLNWAVLHYSGAAKKAGQSYQGALLCSKDGKWPKDCAEGTDGFNAIEAAFDHCGLQLWELYGHGPPHPDKDNSFMWNKDFTDYVTANPPPLDRIGDITITQWREQERAKATANKPPYSQATL